MERTLVLFKPDAMQRGLAGTLLSRLENRGLKIVGMKMLKMDRALAERHYGVHKGKAFFDDLVKFITACPIIALVIEGERAIELVRQSMGATDPLKAAPGTIRADLGINVQMNMVHGSDSPENAAKEIALFFKPEELFSWSRDLEKWMGY